MVSLEVKNNYLISIRSNLKLSQFNNLLIDSPIQSIQNEFLNIEEEKFIRIISSIQSNDKTEFQKYYLEKNKNNPNVESPAPFVNDDFLVFALILGIIKFNLDKTWIKEIVSIRSKNIITTTFLNILLGDYFSKGNQPEIVFMFLKLTEPSLINNDFMNSTLNKINLNIDLFQNKFDILILCSIHSYNSILMLKEAPSGSEIELLKTFDRNFHKRAMILSWIFQLGLLYLLLLYLFKLPFYSKAIIEKINKYNYIFTIIGALGISILGNRFKVIRRISLKIIFWLFGYPKSLKK